MSTNLCACKDRPANQCPGEWEPGCDLGNNPAHAVGVEDSSDVDEALGLQAISIRLPKPLIDAFKVIGEARGMKYQPLLRKALEDYVRRELGLAAEQTP